MSSITLYEYAPTRSARVRWTLLELGIDYESVGLDDPSVFGNPDLFGVHPLGKVPAAKIHGKPLFESAAICTYIADQHADKDLIAKPGTYERALHDQWCFFVVAEMESWVVANLMNIFILPEEKRITACIEQCKGLYQRAASLLDRELADKDYLVGDRFSITDIIAGYAVNSAEQQGYNEGFEHLKRYVTRLKKRTHCTLQ